VDDRHEDMGPGDAGDSGATPPASNEPAPAAMPAAPTPQWTPPPAFTADQNIQWNDPDFQKLPFVQPQKFVSGSTLARIVQVLLVISGLLALANGLYYIYGVDLQGRINIGHVLQPDVNGYNSVLGSFVLVRLGLEVVCGIAFLRWMWRSIRNSTILDAGVGISTPRAAVLSWLIPIYNVVQPYRVMADLHDRLLNPLESRPGKWLLRCWWIFWLLGGFMGEIVLSYVTASNKPEAGSTRMGVMALQAVANAIALADAILAITVVRQIQRLSDARLVARNGDPNRAIELVVKSQRPRVTAVPFAAAAIAVLAIALPTGFVYARSSAAPTWTTFGAPDRSFTVSMPVAPLETPIASHVSGNMVISGDTFRSASNENLVFQVTYDDYPTGALSSIGSAKVYQNMDSTLGQGVDSTSNLTIGGRPAQEVRGHNGVASILAHFLVVGDRVYVIEADFTSDQAGSPDISHFLDSFTLP
jgi:Domain of unknown function (DUF4328)